MNPLKLFFLLFCSTITTVHSKMISVATQAISGNAFDSRTGILYGGCTAPNGPQSLFKVGPINEPKEQPITSLANTYNNHAVGLLKLGYTANNNPFLAATISAAGQNDIVLTNVMVKNLTTNTESLRAIGNPFGVVGYIKNLTTCTINDHTFIIFSIANDTLIFPGPNAGLYVQEFNNDLGIVNNDFNIDMTTESDHVTGLTPAIVTGNNKASMKWDTHLQRLFVGISGATEQNPDLANCIVTLSCFKFNNDFNALDNIQLNANAASYGFGNDAATSSIIGATIQNAIRTYSINNLDTMHTSTDKNYAIINGGRGTPTDTKMKLFAIPLVGPSGNEPGALAKVLDRTNALVDFKTRVSESENLFKETDTAAIVGGRPLPCPDGQINKMEVIGDTVYCATSATDDANNTPGLYFSQAIFNNSGAISRWTDWTLAAPLATSGSAVNDGSCFSFAVDAARGKLLTIHNNARTLIHVNEWIYKTDLTTFNGQINSKLQGPCYSYLSLDQYVENVGNTISSRFALFGGYNKVVAIRTGVAGAAGYNGINKPTWQWNNATNAAVTLPPFPENVGPVLCLFYTQIATGDGDHKNFFFAGTNLGLYIFDADSAGNGFNIGDANVLSTMNHANNVFTKGAWYKMPDITSPVTKIVKYQEDPTINRPLAMALVKDSAHGHRILTIEIGTTVEDTQVTSFDLHRPDTLKLFGIDTIYDIHTIKLNNAFSFLMATNKGIINSISNMNFLYDKLVTFFGQPQATRSNETFYTLELIDDLRTSNNLPKMIIKQLIMSRIAASENKTDAIYAQPAHGITTNTVSLNLADTENNQERIANLHQLQPLTHFYNTGALRWLFMRTSETDATYNKLIALPYEIADSQYNIKQINDIADPELQKHEAFYWIANIGAGYTMAGTDKGVISLE